MIFTRPTALPIVGYGQPDSGGFATMRVTSPFAQRSDGFHAALDIGNFRLGDTVTAMADGIVYGVGHLRYPWSTPSTKWASGNYGGLMIVIRHSSRIFSVYAHLQAESVSLGQRVQAGQPIGLIGDSGSAKGQGHLHVAVVVATETQLDALRNAVRTVPKEMCRDPWPLITHEKMLSVLGTMIPYMEGGADDMRFPNGWNPVHNKRTIILASETPNPDVGTKGPVNLRSMPGESEPLPDATIVQTIKERTYLNVRGYVDTPIGRWYGGELWWGQSWVLLFVHSALCTQLEDIYKPNTELVKKLEQIAEIATSD